MRREGDEHRDRLCITNKSLYKQIKAGQTLKDTAAERMTSDIDGRWAEIDGRRAVGSTTVIDGRIDGRCYDIDGTRNHIIDGR